MEFSWTEKKKAFTLIKFASLQKNFNYDHAPNCPVMFLVNATFKIFT